MRRRVLTLVSVGLVTLPILGNAAPASADVGSFVTINAAPAGAQVAGGEHFDGSEYSNTRPIADGSVGPLPVFFADDQYGCSYATAAASGITEWIALARRRGEPCDLSQTKTTVATAAGAEALIVINDGPGHESTLAVGAIPAIMIDQAAGNRLKESLNPANPSAVKVTLEILDLETLLPPSAIKPTSVSSLNASTSGGGISVNGVAAFGGQPAVTVATDDAGDGPAHPDTSRQVGVDLLGGQVSQPDPASGTLVFEWKVTNLPASGTLPEAIRYMWPFQIDAGGTMKQYMLQAKLTNLAASTTPDDPAGTVTHTGASFQLRGNCGTLVAIQNCPHLAWLEGSFDAASDTVRMELPLGQPYAPEVVAGATLAPFDFAGGTIAAAYQAVVSNATVTDYADWGEENAYSVAQASVRLGIAPAGTNPDAVNFTSTATVAGDGSFTGSVTAPGPGNYEVFAKACFGSNCAVKAVPISI